VNPLASSESCCAPGSCLSCTEGMEEVAVVMEEEAAEANGGGGGGHGGGGGRQEWRIRSPRALPHLASSGSSSTKSSS
jgi:hypothetical protein